MLQSHDCTSQAAVNSMHFRIHRIVIPLMDSLFFSNLFFKQVKEKKNFFFGLFRSLFFTSATFTVGKVHSLLDLAEH